MQKSIQSTTLSKQSKQILTQMLKQSLNLNQQSLNQIKQNKNIQLLIQNKINKICQLAKQLEYSNDTVGLFCINQLEKKHTKISKSAEIVYPLYNKQIYIHDKQAQFGCFCRQIDLQYTYLLAGSNFYIFDNSFIPILSLQSSKSKQNISPSINTKLNITFILSQSRIHHILSYIQLCLYYNRIIRCIMPVTLWQKIRNIFNIFWNSSIYQLLIDGNVVLYGQDKLASFDFQSSMLFFSKNLWYWYSYQIYIFIKGSKYAIKNSGIKDQEIIYVAWRKDAINQSQYCRLIDKTMRSNITWSNTLLQQQLSLQKIQKNQQKQYTFKIKQECLHYLTSLFNQYNSFCQCQIFSILPLEIINQLYLNGQISQSYHGQILYKAGTRLDNFFVLLQGQLQLCSEVTKKDQMNKQKMINASGYYDLQTLLNCPKSQKYTLKTHSNKALVYSIRIQKIKYILGHFIQQLKKVYNQDIQSLQKQLQLTKLSKWMLKVIKVDISKSWKLSTNTTKNLMNNNIKITNNLWKQICSKNLQILSLTKQKIKDNI